MAAMKNIPERELIRALRKHAAIYSLVADDLGCTRENVGIRVRNSPKLLAIVKEVEETILDLVDGTILKAIKAGDLPTTRWYGERKGKSRNYGNSVQTSFDDTQLAAHFQAIAEAFGGDPAKYRAALVAYGVDPDNPTGPAKTPA